MAEDLDVEELLEATYNKTNDIEEGSTGNYDNDSESDQQPPSDKEEDKEDREEEDDEEYRKRHKKKKHRRSRSKSRSKSRSPKRKRRPRSKSRSRSRDRHSYHRRNYRPHDHYRRRSRDRFNRSRSRDRYRRSRSRDRYRRSHSRDKRRSKSREKKRSISPERRKLQDIKRNSPPFPMGLGLGPGPGPQRRPRSPDPEPPSEERDRRTVMCMQLSARVGRQELLDFFQDVGNIKEVHVISDRQSRRSKGIAYVEFENEMSITPALQKGGQKLCGIPIIVQPTMAEKNRLAAAAENLKKAEGPRKLYVGSLHYNINEEMLRAVFEPFGQVENVLISRDTDTGISRGYGFIQFRDSDVAERAKANLNGLELAGRPIVVNHVTEKDYVNIDSLDGEDSDIGVGMTPQSRASLMAKLAEGHNAGLSVPKLQMPSLPIVSSCFVISNMFDPTIETGPTWDSEIREDVLEECMKFGNVLHVQVDKFSQGNVYVKCQTPQVAHLAMASFNGRFYAKKQITAQLVPESTYHLKYPAALAATLPIRV